MDRFGRHVTQDTFPVTAISDGTNPQCIHWLGGLLHNSAICCSGEEIGQNVEAIRTFLSGIYYNVMLPNLAL